MNDKNLLNEGSLDHASRIPYRLIDFYEWVCTGDRPNGGDYYLGFMNNQEWQLQIYTGRTQVNFCRKDHNGLFSSVANMILHDDTKDIDFVQVYQSRGYADYDHPICYPMFYTLDDIAWTASFGNIGLSIRDAIVCILDNDKKRSCT